MRINTTKIKIAVKTSYNISKQKITEIWNRFRRKRAKKKLDKWLRKNGECSTYIGMLKGESLADRRNTMNNGSAW